MAATLPKGDTQPMGEMNTTPLIDVMLVLLIMFVITIPAATHSLEVDLPRAPTEIVPDNVTNKLVLDAEDRLVWNGDPIDRAQLATLLDAMKALPVTPELQFEPDAQSSYAASADTLRVIEASGIPSFGFVGNERYREFGREEPGAD